MILDSSAVIAILLREPGFEPLRDNLKRADHTGVGAPTLAESGLVLATRLGPAGRTLLARFVREADIEVIDFTREHWSVAADAFSRYGKGRHPAALNFGDCMSYAVAVLAGEPLLCRDDDFPATDLPLVFAPTGTARADRARRPAAPADVAPPEQGDHG